MNIWIIIVISFVVRLLLSSLFPLTADESYYWLWSKHLSLSYVDHPPMVGLVNFLMTFGTENLFMVRLGAVLITTLVTLVIYFLAKEVFEEKIAFWSAVLFQIIPHFVVVWLTQFVELPLAFFWSVSLLVLLKIIRTPNTESRKPSTGWWLLLGLTVGLGTLSKYTMFLFWPCLAIFFYIVPEQRFWLRRKELYLCFLLSAACFLPVLIWNSQHGWASFVFQGNRVTAAAWGESILPFIVDQLVHFTPFLLFALYHVFRYGLKKNAGTRLLLVFSAPVLLLFFSLTLKTKIWAHWPSIGYIAAIPLTIGYLAENGKNYKRFILWTISFTILVLSILFWISPAILRHQKDYARNYQLADLLLKEYKIFAQSNVSTSLLEFYAKRPTYLATGFLRPSSLWGEKQYELWGIPNLIKGETILYYGEDTADFHDRALKYFIRIEELPGIKLYLVEDYITNNYKMFKLEGYKETAGHP